ncbi:MAG: hypothetical protein ACHQAU_01305 [Gammaproteobacteria bacterium]
MQTPSPSRSARTSGILLIAFTVLSILAMARHPSVASHDIHDAIAELSSKADLSAWVHGILIALLLAIYWCLTEFSLRRGVERPLVRAGLVFYGAGVVAMIGAAAISGFVTARVPSLAPPLGDQDLHITAQLINFSALLNGTLADIGAVAMSAGILAWSVGLLHSAGWARGVGVIGILAGLSPALALIMGGLHLDVQGMMLVILVQAVWNICIGTLLISERPAD